MNASDMRDNTMGRIAIALFGEKNNRTDEECVAEIDRLRAERNAARALLRDLRGLVWANEKIGEFSDRIDAALKEGGE